MRTTLLATTLLASALAISCDDGDDDAADQDASTDTSTDTDTDTDTGTDSDPSEACAELGLEVRPFEDVEVSSALKAKAADFTLATTEGDWNLAQNWSGCDSYLFIQDFPAQNDGLAYGYGMWEIASDVRDFVARSPLNVHYFFMSYAKDEEERLASLEALEGMIDDGLGDLPDEDAAWLAGRMHYATERASDIESWIGTTMGSPAWGVGIDRAQTIRYIGSYADHSHYVSGQSWPYGPNIAMAANEAIYYNYEADREERLEAEDATVLSLWTADPVADDTTGESKYLEVTLPDATTMAGFDTLELDMGMTCKGAGEFGYCPAWDYNVYLYLCDEATPDDCTLEIGHWITSYHREGRWVHDVSAVLPILAAGGTTRRFYLEISDPWEITASLRFSDQGKDPAPFETHELFAGNVDFTPTYNDAFSPMVINIPADAAKVEIATAITGHGMSSPGNCAEFCDTDHHFYVNGTDNELHLKTSDSDYGCMDQIADGTVPNQYGTWWFGRGGWCPGKHVEMVMTDVTSQVTPGADNTFDYEGFYNGSTYSGSSWVYIRVSSFLLISK